MREREKRRRKRPASCFDCAPTLRRRRRRRSRSRITTTTSTNLHRHLTMYDTKVLPFLLLLDCFRGEAARVDEEKILRFISYVDGHIWMQRRWRKQIDLAQVVRRSVYLSSSLTGRLPMSNGWHIAEQRSPISFRALSLSANEESLTVQLKIFLQELINGSAENVFQDALRRLLIYFSEKKRRKSFRSLIEENERVQCTKGETSRRFSAEGWADNNDSVTNKMSEKLRLRNRETRHCSLKALE